MTQVTLRKVGVWTFFELGHLTYFLGVVTVVPLRVLVPVLIARPLFSNINSYSGPSYCVVSYPRWGRHDAPLM